MPAAPLSADASLLLPAVFDALPGAFLLLSPALLIEAATDDYVAATLVPRAQLLGRPLFEVFPDNPADPSADGVRKLRASFEQVRASGRPHTMPRQRYHIPDPDPNSNPGPARPGPVLERHWLPRNLPVFDDQGQLRHFLHTIIDVTAQVRAEAELAEIQTAEQTARTEAEAKRQRFYEVLIALPAQVATYYGPDHVFQFVNPRYQRYFPRRRFQGRPLREALPEMVGLGLLDAFDRVYRTGEPYYALELEAWFDFQGNGQPEQIFVNLFLHPLRDAQGRIDGVLDFSYDVTEPVRARRALEQLNHELETRVAARTQETQRAHAATETQKQRLERLFRQAPAAICILAGPDFVYELVNPAYQALSPGRALLGKPLLEAVPEAEGQRAYAVVRHVYETGEPFSAPAMRIPVARAEDGVLEDRYFNLLQQPRTDEHGRIDGVVAFCFEVTAQVRAQAALQASHEQLTRTNIDLDNFIYAASHDLRTPIINIEGLLLALRTELLPQSPAGEVTYILDLMQGAVDRFQRTIEHLTDVTKLQRENDQPARPVPLADLIEDLRLDLAPLLQDTHGRLDVDVQATPTVLFSEKNLRSVVYNLLSNALKYRHPDRAPHVRVRSRPDAGGTRLDVHDNGLGLKTGQIDQLFTMFRRLHSHVEGAGIGLYMVKKMVENAGGRITVASQPGLGSTFSVWLPGAVARTL